MPDWMEDTTCGGPVRYRITLKGRLRENWLDWWNGLDISTGTDGSGAPITILTGCVADQAVLRGMLCRLWDLNVTILEVLRLDAQAGGKEGGL